MWEDPVNKGGGRWVLNLDRRQRLHDLNKMWLETVPYYFILPIVRNFCSHWHYLDPKSRMLLCRFKPREFEDTYCVYMQLP